MSRAIGSRFVRFGASSLVVTLSACATPAFDDEPGWTEDPARALVEPEDESDRPSIPLDAVGDGERLADDAARAYAEGDLERAEALFESLQHRDPNDRRAIYNLAMLRLQRAYEGLERYLALETRADQRQRAGRLLQRLGELR